MKRLLLLICILVSSYAANAQFVLTPSGLVSADDGINSYVVVNMEGKTQAEIYDIVALRLNRMYNHPNITQSKIEPKSIQISGITPNYVYVRSFMSQKIYGDMAHTINIEFKDGRMKVDILSFSITDTDNGFDVPVKMPKGLKLLRVDPIYSASGRLKNPKGKDDIEIFFNTFVENITKDDAPSNDW